MVADTQPPEPTMRPETRKSVRRVLRCAIKEAAGVPPTADATELAASLEEVCYANHWKTPLEYCYRALKLPALLRKSQGLCLETSVGAALASGEITPEALSAGVHELAAPPPGRRATIRSMFYRLLGAAAPDRVLVASELERGCYNKVIDVFERAAEICSWDNPRFLNAYSTRVGQVAANLDPAGSVARSVGFSPVLKLLEKVKPGIVGALPNDQLCPQAHWKTKDTIRKRQRQTVEEIRTNLYQCPKCGIWDSSIQLVQTRSLDEPTTVFCTCRCGNRFLGS